MRPKILLIKQNNFLSITLWYIFLSLCQKNMIRANRKWTNVSLSSHRVWMHIAQRLSLFVYICPKKRTNADVGFPKRVRRCFLWDKSKTKRWQLNLISGHFGQIREQESLLGAEIKGKDPPLLKLRENNGILWVRMSDDPKETRGIEGGRLSRKKAVKSPSFREYRSHCSLVYVLKKDLRM